MKKLVICIVSLVMVMAFAGCSANVESTSSNSTIETSVDQNTVTATFENSDGGGMGYVTINEGENLLVNCEMEGGSFNLKFAEATEETDEDADMEEETINDEDVICEIDFVSSEDMNIDEIPAGDYKVLITASDKATGTIVITSGK